MKYKFAIGYNNFKKLINEKRLFVDKTLLVSEFLNDDAEVTLIPRPRRFGKTLNMSMLKYFLDIKENSKDLFKGFKIYKDKESMKHMNQYPVIFFSLKDVKSDSFDEILSQMGFMLERIYKEYAFIKDNLKGAERKRFEEIENGTKDRVLIRNSINELTKHLERYYNKKVIVLIDEYDAPIYRIHGKKDSKDAMNFFADFLETSLKDNNSVGKSLVTGVSRIAKNGMFSRLNNVKVRSVLDKKYSEYFGFTEEEVKPLIEYAGLDPLEAKSYYNGYNFSGTTMYNPWSIINYLESGQARPYWVNTGTTELLSEAFTPDKSDLTNKLHDLMAGKEINITIDENIELGDLNLGEDNFMNLLLSAGYLTVGTYINDNNVTVKIPNREVKEAHRRFIKDATLKVISKNLFEDIFDDFYSNEEKSKRFDKEMKNLIMSKSSYLDIGENFYHGITFGLTTLVGNYEMVSNIEYGKGRPDLVLENREEKDALIIEVKEANSEEELKKKAEEGIQQIKDKKYFYPLKERNNKVRMLSIAFYGKELFSIYEEV